MGVWDNYTRILTNPNALHNKYAMESMFEGIGLMEIELYQDPKADLNNQICTFYESDLHKTYACGQGKYDENVSIDNFRSEVNCRHWKIQNLPQVSI